MSGVSGGVSASFGYDRFGRRRAKTVSGTTTQFLYDGLNPVQELASGTTTANLLTGLGIDEYFTRTDAAGARHYLTDALGSSVALADGSGAVETAYTYEPFGGTSISGAATTNAMAFTGREVEGGSLHFYRARYYDARLQRFVSQDPLRLAGGPNAHGYALNSPTMHIDPTGLDIMVIEGGPTTGNPIGHTSIAITGYGVFSFGNGTALGSSTLTYILREAARRDSSFYIIHTTPAQDAEARPCYSLRPAYRSVRYSTIAHADPTAPLMPLASPIPLSQTTCLGPQALEVSLLRVPPYYHFRKDLDLSRMY